MSFRRATAVTNFPIGVFVDSSTGNPVTTGTVIGKYMKDGVAGTLSGTITYNATLGQWVIDQLTTVEMDGLILGLTFTLTGCLPISYRIKTELSDNLTINPVGVTVSSGQVSSNDLIAYQKAAYTFTFSLHDDKGQPIDLTGKSLSFIVFDPSTVTAIYTLTTGGGNITVDPVNTNQVTVQSTNVNTQTIGINKWVLRDTTDVTVLATGTIKVIAEA